MFKIKCIFFYFSSGYLKSCPTLSPLSTHFYPKKILEIGMQSIGVVESSNINQEVLEGRGWEGGELYKEIHFVVFFKDTPSSLSPDICV